MKPVKSGENHPHQKSVAMLARAFTVAGFLFALIPMGRASSMIPGGGGTNSSPTYTPLDSWSFRDSTSWTSDYGYAPVSFTNLDYSYLGNGASLIVNSTNPAWLQFNVVETNGVTNLTVDTGTVMFWFAPGSWSGTNEGGTGPGEYGRLLEVGACTPDSSLGWWSLYVDDVGANIYFSAQTNDLSSNVTTYLSAPIAWTTNYFHFVVLTYSATNTALYLDGVLATNGPPLTVYPGPEVLANGFYIGSDSNGVYQADGLFNDVVTYNVPLDATTIQEIFTSEYIYYEISPWNTAMMANIISASSSTTTYTPLADVITGAGFLQANGQVAAHNYGTNAYQVWITNVTATAVGSNTTAISFTIEGGQDGCLYDVFGIGTLPASLSSGNWAWLGQGGHFTNYTVSITCQNAFLLLGTPQDSDSDGLTDAYEYLVSHSSPTNYTTDGSGMADGWEILYFKRTGIDPNADPDGDGLSNYQEFQMYSQGYNPTKLNSSTNSVVGDGYLNFSGDGLANLLQASFGGNLMTNNPAWKVNASGDGLSDEYKTWVGLSPSSATPATGLPACNKNPIQ
jgi:hypothetical protein